MSIKIYTAYRLKETKDLWPFVYDTHSRGKREVTKRLRLVFDQVDVDLNSDAYRWALGMHRGNKDKARLYVARNIALEAYKSQASKASRDMFDFDVSVYIREHKGKIYVVPSCDMQMARALDFLRKDLRLEDFAYWNNTDSLPGGVTREEFNARGKIWKEMNRSGGWRNSLTIEICSVARFYIVDPLQDDAIRPQG